MVVFLLKSTARFDLEFLTENGSVPWEQVHSSQMIECCKAFDCDYLVLPVILASKQPVHDARVNVDVWIYGTDDEVDLKVLANWEASRFIVHRPQRTTGLFGGDHTGSSCKTDNNRYITEAAHAIALGP